MDYLQYNSQYAVAISFNRSFKPCYKWITFNIKDSSNIKKIPTLAVLNLVINGLPSIYNTFSNNFYYGATPQF